MTLLMKKDTLSEEATQFYIAEIAMAINQDLFIGKQFFPISDTSKNIQCFVYYLWIYFSLHFAEYA